MNFVEWFFRTILGETNSSPPVVVRSVRAKPRVNMPSPAVPKGGRVVPVARDQRSLCEIRGWRREGNKLVGVYRTRFGSFAGEINLRNRARPEFFIFDAPASVLKGPHGSCFRQRAGGKHFVHFGRSHPEVDAGIAAIERIILTALKRERKTR